MRADDDRSRACFRGTKSLLEGYFENLLERENP
jgi:hypothetical protein